MTLRDIIVFLYKWKNLLRGLTFSLVALVTVLVYILDPSYSADTKIVVESNRMPTMRDIFAPTSGLVELLTTEAEMVTSRSVMTLVVDELHPQDRPRKPSAMGDFIDSLSEALVSWGLISQLDPREKWIIRLTKQVKAKPVANSGVIKIQYVDSDPQWAAKIINSVTRHYIEHHLAVYEPKGGTGMLLEQIGDAEQDLAEKRKLLRDYNQLGAITALAEQRQELVRSNLAFKDSLVKARNELDELRSRYSRSHESVQLAEQRVARLENTIEQQQNELQRLEKSDSDAAALRDAVNLGEGRLQSLRTRYNEAKMHEDTNVEMLNVRVIDYATPPKKTDFSRLLLILLAFPLGFFLSLALALLFEYFDHRVDDQDLARELLGIPSLGYVPLLPLGKAERPRD